MTAADHKRVIDHCCDRGIPMRKIQVGLLVLAIITAVSLAARADEIPTRLIKLSDKVLVFKCGELHPSGVNVTAIVTKKGIVVIDTSLAPSIASEIRRRIETEFGRSDFSYVINTHFHFDHTNGNQVFSDAIIIGHDKCPAAMRLFADGLEGFIAQRRTWLASREEGLKALDPNSNEAKAAREMISLEKLLLADLSSGFVSTPPSMMFSDRMTLQLGDVTLELIYYGPAHTEDNIFIYVPEEKLLVIGDQFGHGSLAMTLPGTPIDVPRWLETLDSLLNGEKQIEHVVGGHWLIPLDELKSRRDYIRELWDGVLAAKKEGLDTEAAVSRLSLENGFTGIRKYVDVTSDRVRNEHGMNIRIFLQAILESAAAKLEAMIRDEGLQKALAEFNTSVRKNNSYYIDEREFNALGYRLLNAGEIEAAIAVFTINTEEFPASWNTWDSLGEAYVNAADKENAVKNYQKSLELNPQNENAAWAIRRIDIQIYDTLNQTKEASRFRPGENTGLKGPYLGQEPPGLEPKVFAPGIVSTAGGFEFSCTFSPDCREFYFNRELDIWWCHLTDEGWTAPEPAPFNTPQLDHEPHITLDGKRLFFGSNRPRPGGGEDPYGIWMMERTTDGWSTPRFMFRAMYVTSSLDGTLYIGNRVYLEGGAYVLHPAGNLYSPPEKLQASVNTGSGNGWTHPGVSPDGNCIVFDSIRAGALGGEGDDDFYVSFRASDGSWSTPVHLTEISTPGSNMCAYFTPDGKYLFYHAAGDIYWVSTKTIYKHKDK
jgi:glyoxylase-like metal-dependent hydrolase (beta-lactamase superfamily II)